RAPAAVTRSCTTAKTTIAASAVMMRIARGRMATIRLYGRVSPTSALRAPRGNGFGGWFAIEFGPAKEQPMNIREVMTPNPQCVSPGDSIQNAARIMRDCDTGAVPVVDNGRPVGIVTDRDIVVRAVAEDKQLNRPVRDIVSADVIYVTPEMSTHEAADL